MPLIIEKNEITKQPFRSVPKNSCSRKFQKTHKATAATEYFSFPSKSCNFIRKEKLSPIV